MITKDDIQTALFKNLFFMPKVWESKKKTEFNQVRLEPNNSAHGWPMDAISLQTLITNRVFGEVYEY